MIDLSRFQSVIVAGVDEVGRGPLAGPVVAAAVILDPGNPIEGLADSKVLTEKRRNELSNQIRENALSWAIARAEVEEIDRLNIFHASLLAMKRAMEGLSIRPEMALIDGKYVPELNCKAEAVIKGDKLVPAISAASIIAKVARDRELVEMANFYPEYGFEKHKGYPTRQHLEALQQFGITDIHRISYAPVKRILDQ